MKLSSPKRQDRHWGPHNLLFSGYWDSFLGVRRTEHGVFHSTPISVEVTNAWSYTSISSYIPSWREQRRLYHYQLRILLTRCPDVIAQSSVTLIAMWKDIFFASHLVILLLFSLAWWTVPLPSTTYVKGVSKFQRKLPSFSGYIHTSLLSENNTKYIGLSCPFFWHVTPRPRVMESLCFKTT